MQSARGSDRCPTCSMSVLCVSLFLMFLQLFASLDLVRSEATREAEKDALLESIRSATNEDKQIQVGRVCCFGAYKPCMLSTAAEVFLFQSHCHSCHTRHHYYPTAIRATQPSVCASSARVDMQRRCVCVAPAGAPHGCIPGTGSQRRTKQPRDQRQRERPGIQVTLQHPASRHGCHTGAGKTESQDGHTSAGKPNCSKQVR